VVGAGDLKGQQLRLPSVSSTYCCASILSMAPVYLALYFQKLYSRVLRQQPPQKGDPAAELLALRVDTTKARVRLRWQAPNVALW
jgi:hypothetical protein